jgi:hypothetical protein
MCYTTGNVAGANPAANPTCSPTNNGCTTGTVVSPASAGVSLPINPPPGQHTFIKAITCGGTAGVNSAVVEQDFFLKPSDVVISPATGSPFSAPVAVTITLAPPPDCYGAGTCVGASQTVSPTICYTTDNSTVSFDPATCTATGRTTCTATTQVDLPIDETKIIRAASCKAGYIAGTEMIRTFTFSLYNRQIDGPAASMLGGVTAAPGDGKFLDAENLIATTDAGYSHYLSITTIDNGNGTASSRLYFGLKGLDLSVNDATHITSIYIGDSSFDYPGSGLPATTTPNTAASKSSTPLPTSASYHFACANDPIVDVVNCTFYQWNGTTSTWNPLFGGFTATRSTALGQLLISNVLFNGFPGPPNSNGFRRFKVFGAINVGGNDIVGFPGPGAIYQHWTELSALSYRNPNDPIYFH